MASCGYLLKLRALASPARSNRALKKKRIFKNLWVDWRSKWVLAFSVVKDKSRKWSSRKGGRILYIFHRDPKTRLQRSRSVSSLFPTNEQDLIGNDLHRTCMFPRSKCSKRSHVPDLEKCSMGFPFSPIVSL